MRRVDAVRAGSVAQAQAQAQALAKERVVCVRSCAGCGLVCARAGLAVHPGVTLLQTKYDVRIIRI
ncbi:hypothetical protein HMPREF0005_01888 [Achromobacter xylosoxidans C54]|nr:hypothetical protein HMPREF0005_01888 [Achromobacter xylosoxidans C54]